VNKLWHLNRDSGRWTVTGRDGRKYLWYRVVMWNETGRSLKLAPAQIDEILASDKSNRELGREYGVSHHAIGRCKRAAA
jgi:hypothetical protein